MLKISNIALLEQQPMNPLDKPDIRHQWYSLPGKLHDAQELLNEGDDKKFAENLLSISKFMEWLANEMAKGQS